MNNALILVDIQNDYFKNGRNELYQGEESAEKAQKALDFCRKNNWHIYHIRHISLQKEATFFLPDSKGSEIHTSVTPLPDEKVIIKHAPNAFYQTDLSKELQDNNIKRLVICGMMSHMCIDTTVRAAKDYGFEVILLDDACTTKDLKWDNTVISAQTVHNTIMASLTGTFANIIKTDEFLESV